MIRYLASALYIFLFSSAYVSAQTINLKAEELSSTLVYHMRNTFHSWSGESDSFLCSIEYNNETRKVESVIATAKIISFDSNIKMRNNTAFKTLESEVFPAVKFISDRIIDQNGVIKAQGTLYFHGVSKTIEFEAAKGIIKNQLCVRGNFAIKLTDFDISPPTLLGFKTEDNIDVKFVMNFVIDEPKPIATNRK